MRQVPILFYFLMGSFPLAVASDAAFHGDGATIFAVSKHHGVKLERETVKITHAGGAPDANGKAAAATWKADVTTTFHNPSSSGVDVTMGLPNWRTFADPTNGDGKWAISQVTVDTDAVHGPILHEEFKFGPGRTPVPLPGYTPLFYDGGYRWTVQMPPASRVGVRARYAFGGFSSSATVETLRSKASPFFLPDADLFWRHAPSPHGGWAFENSHYRTVAYLATPGRTWSGSIGESEIAIEIPPRTLPHLLVPQPGNFSVVGGFVRWHFKNWEPQRPISIVELIPQLSPFQKSECPAFDTPEQAEAWLRFARRNVYDQESLLAVKNAVLAKHGFAFPEKKWADYFKVFSWYRPKRGVTLQTLPETDRKILSVLETSAGQLAE